MGRRKIEIKPIRDDRNRSVTFLKRKGGLFKKAHELSVLCSVDVAVIIFGHNKKLYEYSSGDINETIGRFQYYGGAHEHKGPADYADKGGGDDDDDDEGGDEGPDEPAGPPQHQAPMMHPQMQAHPNYQHLRQHTPQPSPPMPNGAMPQFQRGPSPLPPGISRPSSRASQHGMQPGHIRRTSSNLVPPGHPHSQGPPPPANYAYQPNPPFYNPAAHGQMQRPQGTTYPPPHPAQALAQHPQIQAAYMQDNRRSSMPPGYPQAGPPPQPNMSRHPSQDHLQPPAPQARMSSPQPMQQQGRPSASPQPPPQAEFSPPHIPQPKPLPAWAKSHNSIFTPIDDSRSLLAQHWGTTSNEPARSSDHVNKEETPVDGGPRAASIDVAAMQRGKANGSSPQPPPARPAASSPQPTPRSASTTAIPKISAPSRSNTMASDAAKRPRLKVQIPSEQSGDEGGTGESAKETAVSQPSGPAQGQSHPPGPSHGVVLPPPSPSAGALLSAGAQGPPNPFARPPPPMSTNPHVMNREAPGGGRENSHIETPISALPSRFMSDNLLPSPSTFYPEWGFGRSGDSNMLPSPLNFQTPIVSNGQGWRDPPPAAEKRAGEDDTGGDSKRAKT